MCMRFAALALLCPLLALAHGGHGSNPADWPEAYRRYAGKPAEVVARQADVRQAWQSLLQPLATQYPWLAQFGTQRPSELAGFNARQYLLYEGCRPDDCDGERYLMLFDPNTGKAWAALRLDQHAEGKTATTRIQWLGAPDEPTLTYMASHLFEFAD